MQFLSRNEGDSVVIACVDICLRGNRWLYMDEDLMKAARCCQKGKDSNWTLNFVTVLE